MELTCGYMQIDTQKFYSKNKILKFNGQICVDGIETFIVRDDGNGTSRLFYCYDKKQHLYDAVKEFYGDKLNEEIDKLISERAVSVRDIKKKLSLARKSDRDKAKFVQSKHKT